MPALRVIRSLSQYADATIPTTLASNTMTMDCWVCAASNTFPMTAFGFGQVGSSQYLALALNGSAGAGNSFFEHGSFDANGPNTTPNLATPGKWVHIAGVAAGITYRQCWLDGIAGGVDTQAGNLAAAGFDRLSVGGLWASGMISNFDGMVAFATLRNVALGAADIARLARGANPWDVRPESIIAGPYFSDDLSGISIDPSGHNIIMRPLTANGFNYGELPTQVRRQRVKRLWTPSGWDGVLPLAAGFPTNNTVLDSFDRTLLGANWTTPNDPADVELEIYSDVELTSSSSGLGSGVYTAASFGADQEVYATVSEYGFSGGKAHLMGRVTSPGTAGTDAYILTYEHDLGQWTISLMLDGSLYELTTASAAVLDYDDKIGFELKGGVLTGYAYQFGNWVMQVSTEDYTLTAGGYVGAMLEHGFHIDYFTGGTAVAGGGPIVESLATVLSGESTAPVALTRRVGLAADLSGQSTSPVALTRKAALATVLSGESTLPVALTEVVGPIYETLVVDLSAQSTAPATLSRRGQIAVALSGESTLPVTWTKIAKLVADLSGQSTLPVTWTKVAKLVADLSGQSTAPTILSRRAQIAVAMSGESDLPVNLTEIAPGIEVMVGVFSGESTLTGVPTRIAGLAVALSGESTAPTTLSRRGQIAVALSGESTLPVDLTRVPPGFVIETLAVDLSASSTLPVVLTRVAGLATVLSGESTLPVLLTRRASLVTALSGESSLDLVLTEVQQGYEDLAVVLSGESTLPVLMSRRGALATALSGDSQLFAIQSYRGQISVAMSGQSSLLPAVARAQQLSIPMGNASTFVGAPARLQSLSILATSTGTFLVVGQRRRDLVAVIDGVSFMDGFVHLLAGARYLGGSLSGQSNVLRAFLDGGTVVQPYDWMPGEEERYMSYYADRAKRMEYRAGLEMAMTPPSMQPYYDAQAYFRALVRDAEQRHMAPEEEVPESKVIVNQSVD